MGGPSDPPYPQAGKPYGGFVPPQPSRFHTRAGFVCGVTMWLWVFYRAKQDLPALLVRVFFIVYLSTDELYGVEPCEI